MRTSEVLLAFSLNLLLENARLVGAAPSAKLRKAEEKHDKIGLALHGGSITAANICGSVMRGFQQQKITSASGEQRPAMDAFDYTSGLSGGNFPHLLYAFAQGTTGDEILDADGITEPEDITAESLRTVPENSMFALFTRTIVFSVLRAIAGAFVHGWDFWPLVVYYHFLEPVGIPFGKQMGSEDGVKQRDDAKPTPVVEFTMTGPPELYPDWIYEHMSREVTADIKEAGASAPNVDMAPEYMERLREAVAAAEEALGFELPPGYDEFYQINPESVLEAVRKSGYQVPVPFFSTPEQVQSSFVAGEMKFDPVTDADTNATTTAEPLNFAPFVMDATDPSSVFSLERLLGFGTALLPIFLAPSLFGSLLPKELTDVIGKPLELPVPTADGSQSRNMSFADGGYNDGTGIPSLVSLKCRKIVSVMMKTGQELALTGTDPVLSTVNSMRGFFGVVDRSANSLDPDRFNAGSEYTGHIFDLYSNGENQLQKLANIMKRQHEAGNPLIATLDNLDVVDNPFWGTVAGEKVDLTIIYALGIPKKFADRISIDAAPPAENKTLVDENGFFTNPDLNYAPNSLSQRNIVLIDDIEDDEGNVIIHLADETEIEIPLEFKLGVEETRMTNFLLSWAVKDAWDGLRDVDGNVIFDGFKSILDPDPVTTTTTTAAAAASAAAITTTTMPAGTDVGTRDEDTSPAAVLKASPNGAAAAALALGALALAAHF